MTTGHMTQLTLEPRVNVLRLWPSEGSHYVGLTFWCSIYGLESGKRRWNEVNYFRKNISCLANLPTVVLQRWLSFALEFDSPKCSHKCSTSTCWRKTDHSNHYIQKGMEWTVNYALWLRSRISISKEYSGCSITSSKALDHLIYSQNCSHASLILEKLWWSIHFGHSLIPWSVINKVTWFHDCKHFYREDVTTII